MNLYVPLLSYEEGMSILGSQIRKLRLSDEVMCLRSHGEQVLEPEASLGLAGSNACVLSTPFKSIGLSAKFKPGLRRKLTQGSECSS